MTYKGDFHKDQTVRVVFSTHASGGGNVAPSSAFEDADVVVYEDGSATQITAGITVTSPFDSETGFHLVEVDLSNSAYERAKDYIVVLAPDETVDSQTITAVPIASFSIENRTIPGGFRTVLSSVTSQTVVVLTNGPAEDDALNGAAVWIKDAATAHQISKRYITDYVGSTKTATLNAAPDFTVAANDVFEVIIGFLDSGVMLQDDAITAAKVATDAVTEIQSGLATASAVATVDANVDLILEDTGTTLPATLATIAGYIDTEIAAILTDTGTTLDGKLDAIDALVDAIKAKTDSLTFTNAGEVDANVQSINDAEVTGDGNATPWDGA